MKDKKPASNIKINFKQREGGLKAVETSNGHRAQNGFFSSPDN